MRSLLSASTCLLFNRGTYGLPLFSHNDTLSKLIERFFPRLWVMLTCRTRLCHTAHQVIRSLNPPYSTSLSLLMVFQITDGVHIFPLISIHHFFSLNFPLKCCVICVRFIFLSPVFIFLPCRK